MTSARAQQALTHLGQRYADRGGFITPRDFRLAADRFSKDPEEAASLLVWLEGQMDWRTC